MRHTILPLLLAALLPAALAAQNGSGDTAARIASALSAAPASVTEHATVVELDGTILRQGSNGWVCMPDNPATPNDSPMCLDEAWRGFMDAYMSRRQPEFRGVGVAYMLQGDFPVSNTDPFATAPGAGNQWVANSGPHVMLIVADAALLEELPTDPSNGGPWVMWKGTPYAHVMIPAPPVVK
ncbi:MAG TPA: hypothetical protein VFZ69_02295 [Longimicrobiales bacterium]